jgi:hypothetical protein
VRTRLHVGGARRWVGPGTMEQPFPDISPKDKEILVLSCGGLDTIVRLGKARVMELLVWGHSRRCCEFLLA